MEEFPEELQSDPSTMKEVTELRPPRINKKQQKNFYKLSSYLNLAATKRNVQLPTTEKRCEIHKYTLAELYNIVKDETTKFETCLIQFNEHKRLREI